MIYKRITGTVDSFRAKAGERIYIIRGVRITTKPLPREYRVDIYRRGEMILSTRRPDWAKTREAAMEFCEGVAAGDIDIDEIRRRYDLEDARAEEEAIALAKTTARGFRDLLDRWGMKYTELLELMDKQAMLSDMAHHYLLEMEGVGRPAEREG